MAGLEDLERVDHPDGRREHDDPDPECDQGVVELPVTERPRRLEPQQQGIGGEQQRPEMKVGRSPALRITDPHEAVVEVVLVGGERRTFVFEPLRDYERGVEDRHRHHEQRAEERDRRRGLQDALDGDAGEQEAERERPGVAHEHPGRVEVVTEKRKRGAADDRRQRGGVGAREGRREDRERARGDRHDSGRQ